MNSISFLKNTSSLYFWLIILLTIMIVESDGQSIKGRVLDQLKEPIPGAQIFNISNGTHAHSDVEGFFIMMQVEPGDTLKTTHIGFEEDYYQVHSIKDQLKIILKEKSISLDEVVISPGLNALNAITEIDIQLNPVNSSQQILRTVPGLFIGQHAGGGKAEQIFLRGFDIDHGTDITLNVDGIPVNMVSHAHGQGYADLHFVIPETIDQIEFGKGPYYADKGNFNTAGYVDFNTKQSLEKSTVKLEWGDFNTQRLLGMIKLVDNEQHQAYVVQELLSSDGFFESPQNFHRLNMFGKYSGKMSDTEAMSFTFSHFESKWDASGQIPQRSVEDASISRFGAIDDTEGGKTGRSNVIIKYDKYIDQQTLATTDVFYSHYDFELYSNFTFFLQDSINGDQIRQQESRDIIGLRSKVHHSYKNALFEGDWQLGIQVRNDRSNNNELSRTVNRNETLEQIQLGDIYETNIGAYYNLNIDVGKWRFNPSVRIDFFDFDYNDALMVNYHTQSESVITTSPKLNILFNHSSNLQFYIKTGKGFHSNDTRVVVAREGNKILPAAYGCDAGFMWKPIPNLLVNTAYWYLFMEQEFVYVGDAGIVEPSGKTERRGIDLSLRYQPAEWLFWNTDITYAHARSVENESGADFIPLAPEFTFVTGINTILNSGIYGGLNLRHLQDRPANETNSIVADGYTIIDMNIGYQWKKLTSSIVIQNLLNSDWKETQFATESQLQNETESVEEIHFTPGTPFFLKAALTYIF